ncbi:CEP164 [Branchiostoma lanceolatum]|uniref:Centrosomal protein of 164 kDa n=2 Tax=Branchiostoma lanceolatum TaxID=7740 RepID=A0A8K0ETW2_BRALA|nr:CEP164 [Branchiostoma lanceolatum]
MMINDQLILEEEYDETYEPTEDEIREYALEVLGLQLPKDQNLLWIAREGINAPLPDDWKPCQDGNGDIYYFNFSTGDSVWDHPCDEYYRKMVQEERDKKKMGGGSSAKKPGKKKKEKKEKGGASPALKAQTQGLGLLKGEPTSPLGTLGPLTGSLGSTGRSGGLGGLAPLKTEPLSPLGSLRGGPGSLGLDMSRGLGGSLNRSGGVGEGINLLTSLNRDDDSESSAGLAKGNQFNLDDLDIGNLGYESSEGSEKLEDRRMLGGSSEESDDDDGKDVDFGIPNPLDSMNRSMKSGSSMSPDAVLRPSVELEKHQEIPKAAVTADRIRKVPALQIRDDDDDDEVEKARTELLEQKEKELEKLREKVKEEEEKERVKLNQEKEMNLRSLRLKIKEETTNEEAVLKEGQQDALQKLRSQLAREKEEEESKIRKESKTALDKLRNEMSKLETEEETKKQEAVKKAEEEEEKAAEQERSRLKQEHDRELQQYKIQLEEELDQMLDEIKAEHEETAAQRRRELEEEHDQAMEELAQQERELQQERTQKEEQVQKAAGTRQQAVEDYEHELGDVLGERKAEIEQKHQKEIDRLKEKHQERMATLQQEHKEKEQKEKSTLEKKLEADLQKIAKENEKKLAELERDKKTKMKQMENWQGEVKQMEEKLDRRKKELQQTNKDLDKEEEELQTMRRELNQKRKSLGQDVGNNESTELASQEREDIQRLLRKEQKELEKTEKARKELEREIQRLKQTRDHLEGQLKDLKKKIKESSSEYQRLRASIGEMKDGDSSGEPRTNGVHPEPTEESAADPPAPRHDRASLRSLLDGWSSDDQRGDKEDDRAYRSARRRRQESERSRADSDIDGESFTAYRNPRQDWIRDLHDSAMLDNFGDNSSMRQWDRNLRALNREADSIQDAKEFLQKQKSSLQKQQAGLKVAKQEWRRDMVNQIGAASPATSMLLQDVKENLEHEAKDLDQAFMSMGACQRLLLEKERKLKELKDTIKMDHMLADNDFTVGGLGHSFVQSDSEDSSTSSHELHNGFGMKQTPLDHLKNQDVFNSTGTPQVTNPAMIGNVQSLAESVQRLNRELASVLKVIMSKTPQGAKERHPPAAESLVSRDLPDMITSVEGPGHGTGQYGGMDYRPQRLSPYLPRVTDGVEHDLETKWKTYFGDSFHPASTAQGRWGYVPAVDQLRSFHKSSSSRSGDTSNRSTEDVLKSHRLWLDNFRKETDLKSKPFLPFTGSKA